MTKILSPLLILLFVHFYTVTYSQNDSTVANTTKEIFNNMVYVHGGKFFMGCSDNCDGDEQPLHKVKINSFSISKFEVTQKQWSTLMGTNPSFYSDCPTCPVENVSWIEIQEFIVKLNSITKKVYRLPTEAEWEYAARGGNKSSNFRYAGSDQINDVAWNKYNSEGKTHPVGLKLPNELGLYDMSGNVWEFCLDWYNEDFYSTSPDKNPVCIKKSISRSLRGGDWSYGKKASLVYNRSSNSPDFKNRYNGFRLALEN